MARSRPIIVGHGHEGCMLGGGQEFQRGAICIHDQEISPRQMSPAHGKVWILYQCLTQERDGLHQALFI